jgi:hypothetical protein
MTMKILIYIFFIMACSSSVFCQEDSREHFCEKNYEVINIALHGTIDCLKKSKVVKVPIKMDILNDSMLYHLVEMKIINENEISYFIQQVETLSQAGWDGTKIKCAKLIDFPRNKHAGRDFLQISMPLYSKDGTVAILYFWHVSRNSSFESMPVYRFRDGRWTYLTSLYSVLGS